MSDNLIPFPHPNGSNGSAEVRVVPYPARARVVREHADHPLDAWDELARLVPHVRALIDLILSLGALLDEQHVPSAQAWMRRYWGLVDELMAARQAIDVAALARACGPDAPPIPRYDEKLDDELAVAQQDLDWLIPALEEITAVVDRAKQSIHAGKPADAAETIGELIGLVERDDALMSFGELFRVWRSYRLDPQGNLIDEQGQVYAHISEFEDDEEER